jgi:hypothetical protein
MEWGMAKKSLRRPEIEDFDIMEPDANGKPAVVGTVRVKPSGILWRPKGKHSFFGVTVEQFAEFAEKNGRKQAK